MPTKIRNIVFIVICVCVLSIAFIYQGAKVVHVLPESWNNGTMSYLENAKLQTRPKLSLSAVKKGSFQTQTEKWITTKVPKRDSVILFNAKAQRGVIRVANTACGFDTIPTFYGSGYSIDDNLGLVVENSTQKNRKKTKCYQDTAEAINEFTANNPNLKIVVTIPDIMSCSKTNPTFQLTSSPIDYAFKADNFINVLSDNVKYVDLSYDSDEGHLQDFFRTDHHWNIKGAYKAFKKIMSEAFPELNATDLDNLITYEKPCVIGAQARCGRIIPEENDKIQDYSFNFSDVEITINDKEASNEEICHSQKYENEEWNPNRLTGRYEEYFHVNTAKIEFNSNNGSGRNLLLIGDSFLNSQERFWAKSFDRVIHIDYEQFKEGELSLKEVIKEMDATDVLILQSELRYTVNNKFIKFLKS